MIMMIIDIIICKFRCASQACVLQANKFDFVDICNDRLDEAGDLFIDLQRFNFESNVTILIGDYLDVGDNNYGYGDDDDDDDDDDDHHDHDDDNDDNHDDDDVDIDDDDDNGDDGDDDYHDDDVDYSDYDDNNIQNDF